MFSASAFFESMQPHAALRQLSWYCATSSGGAK